MLLHTKTHYVILPIFISQNKLQQCDIVPCYWSLWFDNSTLFWGDYIVLWNVAILQAGKNILLPCLMYALTSSIRMLHICLSMDSTNISTFYFILCVCSEGLNSLSFSIHQTQTCITWSKVIKTHLFSFTWKQFFPNVCVLN